MTLRHLATLRARLVLGTAASTAAILLLAGLAVYLIVRLWLVGEFDRSLGASAQALAALTEQDAERVKLEPEAGNLADYARKASPDYFTIWLDDGRVVGRSASLAGGTLRRAATSQPIGSTVSGPVVLPDGHKGRQATLVFLPPVEEDAARAHLTRRPVTLVVARHTADLRHKLESLGWLLTGTGAAATLAAVGVMLLVVRRGLAPLSSLAAKIAAAGRADLGERVELAGAPGELTAVVRRLNELLDRVQSTVVRERRFTADVAHELRTPLAGLEATLDVCATRRRMPEEYERTLAKCARIVRAMHAMVENLMTLARADANQLAVRARPVGLAELVQDAWAAYADAAAARHLSVTFDLDPTLEIRTDPEKLRIVLNNLLDNAVSHADAGGSVRVEGRWRPGDEAEVAVANTGSALTPEQAESAFDRFWRGDAARGETGVHCGLGLALCREIVEVLGGRMAATSVAGGSFTVRLALPRGGGSGGGTGTNRAPRPAVARS